MVVGRLRTERNLTLAPVLLRRPGRTASPSAGPRTPPAMIPAAGSQAKPIATPMTAPATAATISRRPVRSPTANPPIAAGKMTSSPNRSGSGMLLADRHADEGRDVPRDERADDRADEVAADVASPDAPEVGDREGECLVGEQVRHRGADPARAVGNVGREGGGVQQVAGVEERRQADDPQPAHAADDVADRDELRRPGEEEDAHRAGLERREPRLRGAQPVDEPEATRRDHDPERVDDELAPRRGEIPGARCPAGHRGNPNRWCAAEGLRFGFAGAAGVGR